MVIDYFNIRPGNFFSSACAEHFEDRLFCGELASESFDAVFHLVSLLLFGLRKDSVQEMTAVAVLLEFDSYERAKYILYARKKEACVYKVPKSEIVVKRAVQKYEKYVEEMRDKLIKAYAEKGAERIIAESLAGQVFEKMGPGKL